MTYNPPIFSLNHLTSSVDHVIRSRKTTKALGDIYSPPTIPENFEKNVQAALEVSGWAPFHFPAHHAHKTIDLDSAVPWRFYPLSQDNCVRLGHSLLSESELDLDSESTIIRLLGACGAMVLVTWLPEPDFSKHTQSNARRIHVDEEHVAAAGAATQNLLLASKARGIDSYWSSGGVLRDWECFDICGIPTQQKLLGAIFLFPELPEHVKVRKGSLREKRGEPSQWMRWITV